MAKGKRSWFAPEQCRSQAQRGYPMPLNGCETRAAAGQPWADMSGFGGSIAVMPRREDMGAAGFVQNFGKVLTNPIGAGVVALHRPQASYGVAGQYVAHTIFWASQTIPTSIPHGSLVSPQQMLDLLGTVNVQAAMRAG